MSTEREKIAILIHHWIEHNEGHRLSYLEWHEKLKDQDLPATLAALETVAELSAQANEALGRAVGELGAFGGHSHLPGEHTHDH